MKPLKEVFSTGNIYAHSPVLLQNLGISLYGLMWKNRRFGGAFQHEIENVRKREDYDAESWKDYQRKRLGELLVHSFRTVPHYRQSFGMTGLDQRSLSEFGHSDLGRLPLLEKNTIRHDPRGFVSEDLDINKLHCYLTSGTTGTPLAVYFSSSVHQEWSAYYEARVRNWAGVNNKQRRAMIGGRLVVPHGIAKPPYWRKNWAESQLYMSAFHISATTAPLYAEALREWKPDYLVGYASSWFFLSRFISELGLRPVKPKVVLTSSEKLTDDMRKTIETAFECPVYDGYSGVEACCLASECESRSLHLSPDVGIVELLDEKGRPVSEGETGEIVATGLINFAQPLIRYRTGDMAVMSMEPCECGRRMPVLKELVGRLEDTVVGLDGREMVRFHGLYVGLTGVRESQVVQESLETIRLRVVPSESYSENDALELHRRVRERLGPVTVVIEKVREIERTDRGKFRAVISRVERKNG